MHTSSSNSLIAHHTWQEQAQIHCAKSLQTMQSREPITGFFERPWGKKWTCVNQGSAAGMPLLRRSSEFECCREFTGTTAGTA